MPFWHSLSALLLADPRVFATSMSLRLLLRAQGSAEVLFAGDAMAPAVRHGQPVVLEPPSETDVPVGAVVVACPQGIPILFRVDRLAAHHVELALDADPGERVNVAVGEILAVARLPRSRTAQATRRARRLRIDLHEACNEGPDNLGPDPAETVRFKYDDQAPMYAAAEGESIESSLLQRIRGRVRTGGRIVVAGSGSGVECMALAREGWAVAGVDFSPEMVRRARETARRRGLEIAFTCGDLRRHREEAGSVSAVVFTYDVYSFVPRRTERVGLLTESARWLEPDGAVFLSAKRVQTPYQWLILTLQWLRARGREPWGASHTRYIGRDGSLHRSFAHLFTERGLRREAASAGLEIAPWQGGHAVLTPFGRSSRIARPTGAGR